MRLDVQRNPMCKYMKKYSGMAGKRCFRRYQDTFMPVWGKSGKSAGFRGEGRRKGPCQAEAMVYRGAWKTEGKGEATGCTVQSGEERRT